MTAHNVLWLECDGGCGATLFTCEAHFRAGKGAAAGWRERVVRGYGHEPETEHYCPKCKWSDENS